MSDDAPQRAIKYRKNDQRLTGIARNIKVLPLDLDERADRLKENSWRRWAIGFVLSAFIGLNLLVVGFIIIIWVSEFQRPVTDRVITPNVVMALIAGTVTQLGALSLALGGALAKRP